LDECGDQRHPPFVLRMTWEGMMKLPRRKFLHLAAGAAALPFAPCVARAQAYPTRPVRILVGIAPGGAPDIVARLIAQRLSERLGQSFIVENRPGGATNIATDAVVRAIPDGYTLLLATSANTINATLFEKLSFNFMQDMAPVASITRTPFVIVVNASFQAKTVPELITHAKANPGRVSFGSPGIGTPGHVAGELLKMMTGIEMNHVPYRGGAAPALTDLMGGQVQLAIVTTAASIELIKSGKLRPLAMTTSTRLELLPEIPTVAEVLPGYEASGWQGVGAPKKTPAEISDKLNREINAALADPKIKARLADLGGTALGGSPADFTKLIAEETEKWGKVIKFAGIKPE
jgi:tripartite-type tricarboxylate transporter receptor subunit TctC